MKMLAEDFLNLSFGIADGTVPIVVITDPVSFKEQVHDPDYMSVTVAGDSLQ